MRTLLLLAACIVLSTYNAGAQFKSRELKKTLELKMPKTEEDDMPGKRGASVVWHPLQKKYYASFAGNTAFPFAVFDVAGKRLSSEDQAAMADVRGLWYNPASKTIEGNGYSEFGWFHYTLDNKGMINELVVDFEGQNQPNEQAVGTYHAGKKKVLFLGEGGVNLYNREGMYENKIELHWGRTKSQGVKKESDYDEDEVGEDGTPEDYNYSSLIYTGIPGAEIGVLNTYNKQVELYNEKDGFLTQKLKLPAGIPAETVFNFAYANGLYWFFDMDKRVWFGCK